MPLLVLAGLQDLTESMPRIPIELPLRSMRLRMVALMGRRSMANVLLLQGGVVLGLAWDESKAVLRLAACSASILP